MNTQIYKTTSLNRDLKKFGLNPKEWTIADSAFIEPSKPLLIQNKEAKDFQLLGRLKLSRTRLQLTEVSLLSL